MCDIFSRADPIIYESRSRTLRIHGVVTSIRLENMVWDVLGEIAKDCDMTTNQLIAKLYDEIVGYRGEVPNLASFLRVSCLRYLHRKDHPSMQDQPVISTKTSVYPVARFVRHG